MSGTARNKHSRRSILAGLAIGGTGMGAAAMALGGRGFAPLVGDAEASWWSVPPVALETAAASAWFGRIGEIFEVETEAGKLFLRLARVQPLISEGARPDDVTRQRAFALQFEGDGDQWPAGAQIYKVRHAVGELDIYFDAASARVGTSILQAVFN